MTAKENAAVSFYGFSNPVAKLEPWHFGTFSLDYVCRTALSGRMISPFQLKRSRQIS